MKWLFFLCGGLLVSCAKQAQDYREYTTRKVIIFVIDGVRWSESWGDSAHANIPCQDSLAQFGSLCTNFRNNGTTLTTPGHTALCTGWYENIANNGTEIPQHQGILQLFSAANPTHSALICSSKDKLWVLGSSSTEGSTLVEIDCGVNGDGSGGYRADSVTMNHLIHRMSTDAPDIIVVNIKDPDYFAHQGDSLGYIAAIQQSDLYVRRVVQQINALPAYAGVTTLMVTNDHGRHLPGISNGFISHGDNCEGCRHISLLVLSPDFKPGFVSAIAAEQIDVAETVAELLHIPNFHGSGRVLNEMMK